MSKVAIAGNASGTGTFTIAAPNSNTDYTLTLPSTNGTVTAFESGTVMLFAQSSAPTGWTKDTTNYDGSALRVVTGTAGTGGTVDFTTAFASQSVSGTVGNTTLSTSQIPSHNHSTIGTLTRVASSGTTALGGTATTTGNAGGGGSHNHSFTGTAIDLAVKYVDVIRATKD